MTDKLERKLTIKVDEKDVTIFMSYGVLNKLLTQFPAGADTGTSIEMAMLDSASRKKVLDILLAPHGDYGLASFDEEKNDIDPDDLQNLFCWAAEHVTDFFLRSAENAKKLMGQAEERISSLTPSESGSAS